MDGELHMTFDGRALPSPGRTTVSHDEGKAGLLERHLQNTGPNGRAAVISTMRKPTHDGAIHREILGWQAHVENRLGSRLRGLRVVSEPPGLVLIGSCATYFVKQLAQHALLEVARLPLAANRIEVVGANACTDEMDAD